MCVVRVFVISLGSVRLVCVSVIAKGQWDLESVNQSVSGSLRQSVSESFYQDLVVVFSVHFYSLYLKKRRR